jgi:2,3-dihydroxybenzoate decarboxylase
MVVSKVVAVEEHFQTRELYERFEPHDRMNRSNWLEGMYDLADRRLREMDEAGIDIQVISHCTPGTSKLDPESAVRLARHANDTLHEAVQLHPDRFAGFAELPMPDPAAAADELERTVTRYGFKGAMINGLCHNRFVDGQEFWPVFARAEALDVPIYFHPAMPHPAVLDAYYKDYPATARSGWGFTVETGTQAVRLIMSGIFDRHPRLKIILGHMGETLPYALWRIDRSLARDAARRRTFREYFCEHFHVTTSGHFSNAALLCAIMEMGVERILFAVDWPFASNTEARAFIDSAPISSTDKDKIRGGNARRLLKL